MGGRPWGLHLIVAGLALFGPLTAGEPLGFAGEAGRRRADPRAAAAGPARPAPHRIGQAVGKLVFGVVLIVMGGGARADLAAER
ncbi:hypothetical protein AB0J72_13530 [Dactylosporangium sp. NPDC049742]|uniref:hypothetical protein n=1 Tax=Dactylosporangium sp. NPDC049742 TaxID=3154737 RepID=UPI003417C14A